MTSPSNLTAPQTKETLRGEVDVWATRTADLRISDAESCVNASHFLRSIKGLRADIQRFFDPHIEAVMEIKRKADAARKGLVDERDQFEAPLVAAEATVKRALLTWETKQEQIRRDEEKRLQAEAQRQAEALTLAAAADLEREAHASGDAGMLQEAFDIIDEPVVAPVVSVATLMPKVQGVTYRDQWKAHPEIDVRALAAAVANGSVSPTFLTPNMTAINQFARATQGLQPVAGVKFWNDRQIAARG